MGSFSSPAMRYGVVQIFFNMNIFPVHTDLTTHPSSAVRHLGVDLLRDGLPKMEWIQAVVVG